MSNKNKEEISNDLDATHQSANNQQISSSSLTMWVQKKILSKLSTRGVVRLFADDRICLLMDTLYILLKHHYDNKSAEKVVKNIIKLTFKLGAMERENVFDNSQRKLLLEIEGELRNLALTIQSFQALRYSYNQQFFLKLLNNLQKKTNALVQKILSEKSVRRVEHIFEHLSNQEFLKKIAHAFPGYETNTGGNIDVFASLMQNFMDTFCGLMLEEEVKNK